MAHAIGGLGVVNNEGLGERKETWQCGEERGGGDLSGQATCP